MLLYSSVTPYKQLPANLPPSSHFYTIIARHRRAWTLLVLLSSPRSALAASFARYKTPSIPLVVLFLDT